MNYSKSANCASACFATSEITNKQRYTISLRDNGKAQTYPVSPVARVVTVGLAVEIVHSGYRKI